MQFEAVKMRSGIGHWRTISACAKIKDWRCGCAGRSNRFAGWSLRGGIAPTGAKDPFGLRRAAIGVVQPLIEHNISFDLREAVSNAAKLQPIAVSDEVQNQVLEFIAGRLMLC